MTVSTTDRDEFPSVCDPGTRSETSIAAKSHLLTGFLDSEWHYYVRSHDEDELLQVDELDVLQWEKLWMREVPGSQIEDEGVWVDDEEMLDGPCWIECPETTAGAEPWMGVKYAPAD